MITKENYDIQNIHLAEQEIKKSGKFSFTVLPIEYKDHPAEILLEGHMKIWEHKNEGKNSNVSIGFALEDENQKAMFEEIESRIRKLTDSKRPELKKLNPKLKLQLDSLSIIKQDQSDYPKIYGKLYTKKSGKINCLFSQKVGEKSKTKIDPHTIIGVPFNGCLILKLRQVFLGNINSISIVGKEVLVKEIIRPQSYFDEYEELDETVNPS